jgi:methylenetetrahydrofolate--tRNA-(uracil-5-)-methyltransferase
MATPRATVVGGGLAGSEAAWQLLRAGVEVELIEARPTVQSPAHAGLLLGELVCSNSLRSDAPDTASGLLKAELRRAGSLILHAADRTRVPAGSALAVDRAAFAGRITWTLLRQRGLRLRRHALEGLPDGPTVLATGPLTAPGLGAALGRLVGAGLHFYDAIAPIVDGASLDWGALFRGARGAADAEGADYVNCPLDRAQYDRLVELLRRGRCLPPHPFEEPRYFEGCLPIEVMAVRGDDVLAHGPMRPVGLVDPRSGRRPYAVIQLRAEDEARSAYNLVGFQTRLTRPEQRRIFREIPGLQNARFLRFGSIHRNTYLDAPRQLGPRLELRAVPHVRVAGQLAGVEGYLESTAIGLLAGLFVAAELTGRPLESPPRATALGALLNHLTRQRARDERFEPQNVAFGLLPGLGPQQPRDKGRRRLALCARAHAELSPWLAQLESVVQSRVSLDA